MKFDSYTRFLKSHLYQECMLAEVEGRSLPDPHEIPSSPTSKHSVSSDRSNFSTPKKVPNLNPSQSLPSGLTLKVTCSHWMLIKHGHSSAAIDFVKFHTVILVFGGGSIGTGFLLKMMLQQLLLQAKQVSEGKATQLQSHALAASGGYLRKAYPLCSRVARFWLK